MQETVNSLFFLISTQRKLKKMKVLKGGFLKSTKLQDVSPKHFNQSIDLRQSNQVPITAAQLSMPKIRKIALYPRFYKLGKDYSITIAPDKKTAAINLLDITKFKNERIVISVK
jgi:hypothetical protein